ncbi:MAG: DUF4252 domain-containing protein [Flavobacteriaceae bacterium]
MKQFILILVMACMPIVSSAQSYFDSLEDQDDITSVIVNANMFNLMSKIDVSSDDPEAQEYLDLIKDITSLKVFVSKEGKSTSKMQNMLGQYLKKANLQELMRIKDGDNNVKFFMKEGSNPNRVSELLMFVQGAELQLEGKKAETVLLTLTGDFDLNKVSKLTKEMNIPGGEHLKKVKKK